MTFCPKSRGDLSGNTSLLQELRSLQGRIYAGVPQPYDIHMQGAVALDKNLMRSAPFAIDV